MKDFKRTFFKAVRPLVGVTYKPLLKYYLSKPTRYTYDRIKLSVLPGVFHPRFFFSTKIFLAFLKTVNLDRLNLLEMGTGSGLISLFAAKRGAKVTACDISETAVKNAKYNADINHIEMDIYHSDMFDKIPLQVFDVIAVAPPYYKKDPVSEADYAWYCGKNMEYFRKFFPQANNYMNEKSKIWMILSDDCDLKGISAIAELNNRTMRVIYEKTAFWEVNYIFEIS